MDSKNKNSENTTATEKESSGVGRAIAGNILGKPGMRTTKGITRKRYESTDQTRNFEKWVKKLQLDNTFIFGSLVLLDKKYSLRNLLIWALFSVVFSFLLFASFDYQMPIKEGEIATHNIKSPLSFSFEDEEATEAKKINARSQVLSVFRYDPRDSDRLLDQVYLAFANFRKLSYGPESIPKVEIFKRKAEFDKLMEFKTPDRIFEWLVESQFSNEIGLTLRTVLENWSHGLLADNPEKHILLGQKKVSLLSSYKNQKKEESTVSVNEIKDIYRRSLLEEDLPPSLSKLNKIDQNRILNLAFSLIKPNVFYDDELTEGRRSAAVEGITPVTILVEKNQTIVNEGAIINETHARMLEQIQSLKENEQRGAMPLGVAIILFIFIVVSSNLISSLKNIERNLDYKVYLLFTVSILCVVMWKIFLFVFDATVVQKFGGIFPQEILALATPMVLPILIAGLLTRSPYLLMVFVMFSSISFSFLIEQNLTAVVVSMASNLAALRTIYYSTKRNDVYKAGFIAAVVAAICAAGFSMVNQSELMFTPRMLGFICIASLVGGTLSALLTLVFVPMFEYLSGVTSNLKLLDLASMNHPILQELMVKAPGTYHHSMVVGSMCEAAAREIGANPLLNKVMGYFHDIGKMKHPTYFIENQRAGENPHDHISPNLSKTIIVAHVKDGIEMALKANLGREIVDGIRQHHGTTLVSYFYHKALKQAEDPESVKEEEFMYPGPKPQFKESAVLMLADSIEAAARSLDDPTPAKLDYLVESMVEKKFVSQQLDECDLNFEEVSLMKMAFYRILLGVYHHRIDYVEATKDKVAEKSGDKEKTDKNDKKTKSANV